MVKSTCNATLERSAERRGMDSGVWGQVREFIPVFRNRLVSSGVYYHLSNSFLRLHRAGWGLIASGATGEEESNWFYPLPDCIMLVCRLHVSVQINVK